MLITAKWYNKPIIYDNQKYILDLDNDKVKIIDKKINHIILTSFYPVIIKQVADNEFIVVESLSDKLDYQYILKHIQYNGETKMSQTIYRSKYKSKNLDEEIRLIDDLFILEGYLDTTIYNPKTRKSLTLTNTKIIEQPAHLKSNYIISQTNIEGKDYLTMCLNKDTLESEQLYSRLQDRVIPITKILDNNFTYNYKNTCNYNPHNLIFKIIP